MPFEGQPIHLTAAQRHDLVEIARSPALAARFVQRAKILLLLADGVSARTVATQLDVSRPTIAKWRQRFLEGGVDGLTSHYRGSTPWKLTGRVRARVLAAARRPPPDGTTHWSCRRLAADLGVSKDLVQRVRREADLRPHPPARHMASTDPDFETRAPHIIGLYLDPPRHAAVFCLDKKTPVQAFDRRDPVLLLSPDRIERHGLGYERHGTLSLCAALSVQTGEVQGKTPARPRRQDFVGFLGEVAVTCAPDQEIHVVLDNLSTQRTKTVATFLDEHPNVTLHFVPTYSSWLHQVELWFSKVPRDVLSRSIFTSRADLARKLRRYIQARAKQAQPFRWKYDNPVRRMDNVRSGVATANRNDRDGMSEPLPIRTERVPVIRTRLGQLYQSDCLDVLPEIETDSVDVVFADPPFNVGKEYGARVSDNQSIPEYLQWCRRWLRECARTLRPGGSFFVYNLPKWSVSVGCFLEQLGLTFRHWIAIEQAGSRPIQGRLYPAHYALLYYSKGRPKTFRRLRTPIEKCRHCSGEIKDYGGHRSAMHAGGVSLKDIWTDIPPVRHSKFKPSSRHANSLSTKLLERVVEMSSEPGDIVVDPFGGSGTTYAVCEQRKRRWIGTEIETVDPIIERLQGTVENHPNTDVVDEP